MQTQSYPVIVPVIIESQRNCIVQEGKTYCEETNITAKQGGWIVLGVVLFLAWTVVPFGFDWYDWRGPAWWLSGSIVAALVLFLI